MIPSLATKKRTKQPNRALADDRLTGRRQAVLENYRNLFDFYNAESSRTARWHIVLQIVTLLGTAITPIVLLVDLDPKATYTKLWLALPASIAGFAAAINASFMFRQDWIQNYTTVSALENEYHRFTAGASPDYSGDEQTSIDKFQQHLSEITMSEVRTWASRLLAIEQQLGKKAGGEPLADPKSAQGQKSPANSPGLKPVLEDQVAEGAANKQGQKTPANPQASKTAASEQTEGEASHPRVAAPPPNPHTPTLP